MICRLWLLPSMLELLRNHFTLTVKLVLIAAIGCIAKSHSIVSEPPAKYTAGMLPPVTSRSLEDSLRKTLGDGT